MPVLVILIVLAAYLAWGMRRLRAHPDASTLLLASALKPMPGLPILAVKVLLWPFLLKIPEPPRRGGAERL